MCAPWRPALHPPNAHGEASRDSGARVARNRKPGCRSGGVRRRRHATVGIACVLITPGSSTTYSAVSCYPRLWPVRSLHPTRTAQQGVCCVLGLGAHDGLAAARFPLDRLVDMSAGHRKRLELGHVRLDSLALATSTAAHARAILDPPPPWRLATSLMDSAASSASAEVKSASELPWSTSDSPGTPCMAPAARRGCAAGSTQPATPVPGENLVHSVAHTAESARRTNFRARTCASSLVKSSRSSSSQSIGAPDQPHHANARTTGVCAPENTPATIGASVVMGSLRLPTPRPPLTSRAGSAPSFASRAGRRTTPAARPAWLHPDRTSCPFPGTDRGTKPRATPR